MYNQPYYNPGQGMPPPHMQQQQHAPYGNPNMSMGGGGGGPSGSKEAVLFIGNLPWDTTESELGAHFSSVGPVNHVRLVTDHQTGKGKGFAFVEYRDALTAAAAIRNLNNAEFRGRPLRVDFSDPAHRSNKKDTDAAAANSRSNASSSSGYLDRDKEELRKVFSSSASGPSASSAAASAQDPHHSMADVKPTHATIPITVGSLAPTVQPGAQPYVR